MQKFLREAMKVEFESAIVTVTSESEDECTLEFSFHGCSAGASAFIVAFKKDELNPLANLLSQFKERVMN